MILCLFSNRFKYNLNLRPDQQQKLQQILNTVRDTRHLHPPFYTKQETTNNKAEH